MQGVVLGEEREQVPGRRGSLSTLLGHVRCIGRQGGLARDFNAGNKAHAPPSCLPLTFQPAVGCVVVGKGPCLHAGFLHQAGYDGHFVLTIAMR